MLREISQTEKITVACFLTYAEAKKLTCESRIVPRKDRKMCRRKGNKREAGVDLCMLYETSY
jgi:hypothetical protein